VTYSICVRERVADAGDGSDGTPDYRFGVAAAARVPAVGSVCPHASPDGAVAVAGVVDPTLGEDCLADLAAGRCADDVVGERAVDGSGGGASRVQLHGVGPRSAAGHTGEDCPAAATHRVTEGCTVGGTALADVDVLDALARGYRENERDASLPRRLLTALAAAERAGGDRRADLVGSAAVAVVTPGTGPTPLYHDLRVDASDSPVADLRETYRRAKRGYEAALDRYAGDQTENS
jgi:uncharacterized Ntn-hydrolase superfamily protein